MLPTVPALSIVSMAASGLICLLLPVLLVLIVRRRYKTGLLPLVIGILVFVLAFVARLYFDGFLYSIPAFRDFVVPRWWASGLYGGLAAGLFEETGRLLAFLALRGRYNNLGSALRYGIGHGGIEAVLLVTVTMANNIILSSLLNISGQEAFLALFPGQTELLAVLVQTEPSTYVIACAERVIAIAFHIAASVLVWMAATGRGPWGLYFLSILFHTMVNFPIGLHQGGIIDSILVMEGITAGVVLVVCVVTAKVYTRCNQFYTPLLRYTRG